MDPTRRRSGGALLGDRIRMNSLAAESVFMRSLATRRAHLATSAVLKDVIELYKAAAFDLVIVETAGIGQSDTEIVDHSNVSLYVMTPEYGAASQLEKIDMLDFADLIALNKFDKRGALDALRDVRKQWRRNHPQRRSCPTPSCPCFRPSRPLQRPRASTACSQLRGARGKRVGSAHWRAADAGL
jgi:methylmalonyl-CoA mutase